MATGKREMYLNLDSQDGVWEGATGTMRFPLPSALRNVYELEWLAFEVQPDHALTITDNTNSLYFSEDLVFFKAVLPCGSYTPERLQGAVESAMACAQEAHGNHHRGPQNTYFVRLLVDSSRLCISSDGRMPFAIHNFHEHVPVTSLRPLGADKAHVEVSTVESHPLARGALVELLHPALGPIQAQILHAVGRTLLVQCVQVQVQVQVQGREQGREQGQGTFDACLEDQSPEPHNQKWSLRAVGHDSVLGDLLGLGPRDLPSNCPIKVLHSSNALCDQVHLGLEAPHGCVEGDVVVLDGFGGSFLNGQEVSVRKVVSDQQLVVDVDVARLGAVKQRHLRFMAKNREFSIVVEKWEFWKCQDSAFYVKAAVAAMEPWHALKESVGQSGWHPVKMLAPIPSKEWARADVHVQCDASAQGLLRWKCALPPTHGTEVEAVIKRHAVVGAKKMNLLHKKSVLLMRIRVGAVREPRGVLSLTTNPLEVFGRAQVREGGFMTSQDHSLVGRTFFDPPLERVPFMDVSFCTAQGCPVHPNILGDFSLLLRCLTFA